ncbi:Cof-type HAD-IIB family hydrolase [Paenibacillus sp. CAU 1782]
MKGKFGIIALDVDGTLLNDDHALLPEVKDAVREAAQTGAEIVLCTGRGPRAAMPIMEELGLAGTMIVHNGGATVSSSDNHVIAQFTMDNEKLKLFLDTCRREGLQFDLNTAFDVMVEQLSEQAKAIYQHLNVEPVVLNSGDPLPEGLIKMSVFGPMEGIDEVQRYWENLAPTLQIIRSGDFFIDIQHPGASKGDALKELALQRGMPRERIFAIGNYYNDISMLQFAGLGIAMDNSPDAVKAAADAVCGSNNDAGAAAALRRYVLGENC